MTIPARPKKRLLAAIALLMTLFAAACSGGDSSSDVASSGASFDAALPAQDDVDFFEVAAAEESESAAADTAQSDAQGVTTTGAAGGEAAAQLPDFGRDIIYTATLELASTDVSRATREAISVIEARGGFLFSQETAGGVGGSSVLTFKILPDQFQAALNALGSVGEVRSQSISADDVSAIVVDLESRINTAEASVIRLRNLLEGATELETIATLENQLLQRETTLEQLRGQLRSVRNQVDLATITVYVSQLLNRPGVSVQAVTYSGHDEGFSCFDGPTKRSGEIGDPFTICYRVTNSGDAPLIDLDISDAAFDTTTGSLFAVDGELGRLEPGETITLAHEVELVEPVRLRTMVTATALNTADGEVIADVTATAATIRFDVTDFDAGFPSFGQVLSNSWEALKTIAIVIALVAVALAPFAAVALVLGIPALRFWRRRQAMRPITPVAPAPPAPPAPQPPPPAMGPADQTDTSDEPKAATTM